MGLLDRLFGRSKKKGFTGIGGEGFIGAIPNMFTGINRARPADFYKSWVYSCTRAIAEAVASIDLLLFEINPSTGEKTLKMDADPMRLLLNPNKIMTKETLLLRLQSHRELFGNEYWHLIKGANNQPIAIFPLRPESARPIASSNDFISAFEFVINGRSIRIPIEDLVHYKNFNPITDLIGMSTLGAAQDAAETDVFARDYNKEFFNNGAMPGAVLKVKGELSPKDKKRLKQAFDQQYAGQGKRYKTFVASGGLDIEQFNVSQKDMEFMEQRKFSRDEILAIFQVPKPIIGILEDVNRASAEAAMFVFTMQTIEPKMKSLVDTLNAFYLPMFKNSQNLRFEFTSPVPRDKKTVIEEYKAAIAGGWMTPNEVRLKEGLDPLENGDSIYLPLNLQPISEIREVEEEERKAVRTSKSAKEKAALSLSEAINDIASKCAVEEGAPVKEENEFLTLMDDFQEKRGETKSNQERIRLTKQELIYGKATQKLWKTQQRTMTKNLVESLKEYSLAMIAKQEGEEDVEVPELLDREKEIKKTIGIFTPLMLATVKIEGDAAFDFLGINEEMPLGAKESRRFVNKHVKRFAGEITDFTIDTIDKQIAEGLAEGEGIRELTKRIKESTAFNRARSEKIARTEVFRMKTQGELQAWKDSGIVTRKIWYTALDERVDPDCAVLHGKEFGLSTVVLGIGDETVTGSVNTYEPVVGPPLHPQCRCTMLPVVSNKAYEPKTTKELSLKDKKDIYISLTNERQGSKETA